jgi:hypothetical protein
MQKLLVWISVLGVVVVGGKYLVDHMSNTAHENTARSRVEAFLDGVKSGGDFGEAFSMWSLGSTDSNGRIAQDQYNMYVGEMNAWLAQRRLAQPIETYEIHGATMIRPPEGIEPSVVDVSCTVDGIPVIIRAVAGQRLAWAD